MARPKAAYFVGIQPPIGISVHGIAAILRRASFDGALWKRKCRHD